MIVAELVLIFAILLSAIFFLNVFIRFYVAEWKREKAMAEENTVVMAERVGCVGRYKDKEIPEFVILEDGRKFEYVSLAYKKDGEVYLVDSNLPHIKIDKSLLYRLVPTPTDK